MSGTGKFAELVEKRFAIACRRLHLNEETRDHGAGRGRPDLDCTLFRIPAGDGKEAGGQMALF